MDCRAAAATTALGTRGAGTANPSFRVLTCVGKYDVDSDSDDVRDVSRYPINNFPIKLHGRWDAHQEICEHALDDNFHYNDNDNINKATKTKQTTETTKTHPSSLTQR